MLAFPMVLEMSGTLRGVVTTVVLIPLEAKTLAKSMLGIMCPLAGKGKNNT